MENLGQSHGALASDVPGHRRNEQRDTAPIWAGQSPFSRSCPRPWRFSHLRHLRSLRLLVLSSIVSSSIVNSAFWSLVSEFCSIRILNLRHLLHLRLFRSVLRSLTIARADVEV